MNGKTVEQIAADAAKQAVAGYVATDEFRSDVKEEYKTQVTSMLEGAEKKARNWALIVTLVVLGVILSLVSSEFLKVKEKRVSLDEEFGKIQVTASQLRETITSIKSEMDRLKIDVDSKDRALRSTIDSLEKKTKDLEAQVTQATARVQSKR